VKTPISNSPAYPARHLFAHRKNRRAEWDGSESTRLPWGRTGVLPIGPSLCRRPVVSFAAVFRPPRPTFRTRRPSYSQGRRTIFIQISFKHNQHRKNLKPEHSGRHSSAALHKNREPSVENFKFLLQTLNQVGQVFNPPSVFRFFLVRLTSPRPRPSPPRRQPSSPCCGTTAPLAESRSFRDSLPEQSPSPAADCSPNQS